MKKVTPNPPTAHIFAIAPNVSTEALLIQTSETLVSLNVMTTDLAFELEGAPRHKLLAAQQLIVLSELLIDRVLDTQSLTDSL